MPKKHPAPSAQPAGAPEEMEEDDCEEEEEELGEEEEEEGAEEDFEEDDYQEFEACTPPTLAQVRNRVRNMIADMGMEMKEVHSLLGVPPGPEWHKFMTGKYKDPSEAYTNNAFKRAAFFFWKEKRLGKDGKLATLMPPDMPPRGQSERAPRVSRSSRPPLPNLMNIETDGHTYITPSEVRKDMYDVFETYDISQARLAKMLGENACMVGRFLADKGEFGGAGKGCYHGLAQFLEKLRIASGTKKSRKRVAIEAEGNPEPFLGDDENKGFYAEHGTRLFFARDEIGRQVVKQQRTDR